MRYALLPLLALALAACAAPPRSAAVEAPAPAGEAPLTVPAIPTVVPSTPLDLAALPPAGVLRLVRLRFDGGGFRVLDTPPQEHVNSQATMGALISLFDAECHRETAQVCLTLDQFESAGGLLLAAGRYASLGVQGGAEGVASNGPWALVDHTLGIVAAGPGGGCPPSRPALSACVSWDGGRIYVLRSGFVRL